jgi:hypothetical protein
MLFSSDLALVVAFALLYAAGLRLTDGSRLTAAVGALAVGSAPLLVNLSHWYLVEPLQTLSVVWVLFAMVSARHWHLSLTAAQLTAAILFGLLVKLSTPLYVAAPVAVALLLSFRATIERPWPAWWTETRFLASAGAMAVLAFCTGSWYRVNFASAWAHAKLSASSTFWGSQASFGTHLLYWLRQLCNAFSLPYFDIALAVLLAACCMILLVRRKRRTWPPSYHLLVLLGCLGVPVAAVALLANQVNTSPRFAAPTIPALALGLVTLLRIVDNSAVTRTTVALFTAQFGLMILQSFDATTPALLTRPSYRSVPTARSALASQVEHLASLTCAATDEDAWNTVGTSYAWLNANTLTMLSAEYGAARGRGCHWAGVDFTRGLKAGWHDLVAWRSPFLLTVDYGNVANRLPSAFQPSELLTPSQDRQLNGDNAALLHEAIGSGRYVVVAGERRNGLVLLRLANR